MPATNKSTQERDLQVVTTLHKFLGGRANGATAANDSPLQRVAENFQKGLRNLGFAAPAMAILLSAMPMASAAHTMDSTVLPQQAGYEQVVKGVADGMPERGPMHSAGEVSLKQKVGDGTLDAPELSERSLKILNAINGMHALSAIAIGIAEEGLSDRLVQQNFEKIDQLWDLALVSDADWTDDLQHRFDILSAGLDLDENQHQKFKDNLANWPGAQPMPEAKPTPTLMDQVRDLQPTPVAAEADPAGETQMELDDEATLEGDKADTQAKMRAKVEILRKRIANIGGNETLEDTQRLDRAYERLADILDKGALSEKSIKDIEKTVEKVGEMVENFRASKTGSIYSLIEDDIAPVPTMLAENEDEPSQPFIGM
jgi:hypothetical protein